MDIRGIFKKKRWSPWLMGALLGFVASACIVLVQDNLGAAGGFERIGSILVSWLGLGWADSFYFRMVKPPQVSFQMLQYIGMILGAFTASYFSRDFKIRMLPDREWTQRFGSSKAKRWALMFLGGILIEFGAGVAGGCTSGLGVSGTMQLSPAGLIFIAGVFISGIVTTKIIYGRNYR